MHKLCRNVLAMWNSYCMQQQQQKMETTMTMTTASSTILHNFHVLPNFLFLAFLCFVLLHEAPFPGRFLEKRHMEQMVSGQQDVSQADWRQWCSHWSAQEYSLSNLSHKQTWLSFLFNMHDVSAQGVDECMINVHCYYYYFPHHLFRVTSL